MIKELEQDIKSALELLIDYDEKTCKDCDLSVGHICDRCFLADLILRMKYELEKK